MGIAEERRFPIFDTSIQIFFFFFFFFFFFPPPIVEITTQPLGKIGTHTPTTEGLIGQTHKFMVGWYSIVDPH